MAQTQDAQDIARHWLQTLANACATPNVDAFSDVLLPDGVYRDLLCLSWDFRSLSGHEAVQSFLNEQDRLARAKMHDFSIDESTDFGTPFFYPVPGAPPGVNGIQLSFNLKLANPPAFAKGLARLMQDPEDGRYKAFTMFTSMHDLVGYEEPVRTLLNGSSSTAESISQKVSQIETDPLVLIVGAAQNGLVTAARLGQMGISALVVERDERVGDGWRHRYDSLTLHTYSRVCSFLYEDYPKDHPLYMPKNMLADALEAYVKSQGLVVWTSSTLLPTPAYDTNTGHWSAVVSKNGVKIQLRPKHIVMATGFAGEPCMPAWPGQSAFKGVVYHSGRHPGGQNIEGKNVVVVGAGQSSADICMDLVRRKAGNITMLQRSSTCVASLSLIEKTVYSQWPDSRSVEASDIAVNSFPQSLLIRLAAGGGTTMEKAVDSQLHKDLQSAGVKLSWGEEYGKGSIGMFGVLLHRFGGYWLDRGCAQEIVSGRIAVKQGAEIQHFDEDGVVLSDGERVPADIVVLATGYKGIRHTAAKIFGAELIGRTTDVWGLDEEGETKGMYRPSGHPGLWYAVGGFNHARFYSRHLGLHILAQELGLKE